MKMSNKDKTLLFALLSIAIVFCAWYFGFRKFSSMTDEVKAEVQTLQKRYDELKVMEADVEKYKASTVIYEQLYDALLSNYDSGFSQKATLLFTSQLEADLEVWMSAVNMAEVTRLYTFGSVGSSNPNNGGATVYQTDMVGYRKQTTYAYECSYEMFKEMLAYVLNYDTMYTVDTITCVYNTDEEIATGVFTISQYAVTGSERPYYEPDIDSIETGTGNLFVSETNPDTGADVEASFDMMTNYDLALTLSSEASDLSSVVLGRRGLTSSQIAANTNNNVAVTIRIEGEEGKYTMKYSVGDKSYPADGSSIEFNPGRSLDLIIFSSPREGNDDKAGASVKIINNSDMTLNIKVLNDDEKRPRFKIEATIGEVRRYR